jgi:hypothetical protein
LTPEEEELRPTARPAPPAQRLPVPVTGKEVGKELIPIAALPLMLLEQPVVGLRAKTV